MKYITIIIVLLLFSCGKKEDVLLPKSNVSVVKDVQDHSPIYIFFKKEGKDTIADLNRKSAIISTNWIFNIDKRLPLKVVIPQVIKMQEKKRADSAHKNENAENYYSYADSIGKNLAFLPFTKVFYKMEKPTAGSFVVYFSKGKKRVFMGNQEIRISEILKHFYSIKFEKVPDLVFLFDKNMSYEEYIQYKILLQKDVTYNLDTLPVEFIF
jgi:biopolymer transport protein ExbD